MELQGASILDLPVVGPSDWVIHHPGVDVVACLGNPRARDRRRNMVERLQLPRERFATLVHPTAVVPASVAVGSGTVVHAMTVATADATVGDHVQIMPSCVITHDARIEDFVTMGAGVRLAGNVTVGRGAYVGSGCLVREGVTIGEGALIGMGAVVLDDVPPRETWVGVPARPLAHPDPVGAAEGDAGLLQ
jgi:sugar O-acyltransferase (sialic acid O-acetyltransferase NeuD family)